MIFMGRAAPADVDSVVRELAGRGARMEILRPGAQGLDGADLPAVAAMLARNGVIALAVCAPPEGWDGGPPWVEIGGGEGAEAGSVLRDLELRGLVPPPCSDLSEEEETLIRERLERLGYL